MEAAGLYLHIPFCAQKCPYCDFYSLPAGEEEKEGYREALCRAMEAAARALGPLAVDTVYFGGGTPTLLGEGRLASLLWEAGRRFTLLPGAEITLEANPGDAVDYRALREAGFNRLSLGVQSDDDATLRLLGRRHDRQAVARAAGRATAAGFENLSMDLMLALPGQRAEDIARSAAFCHSLGAKHLSAYLLKVEAGTPFAREGMEARCPGEEESAALYLAAVRALEGLGLRQYEISNFAAPGRESRHNLHYWRCEPYLGLGPSAHSFVGGRRRYFARDFAAFLAAENPLDLWRDDGPGGGLEEALMLRLRLAEGVRFAELGAFPAFDPAALLERAVPLAAAGLLRCDGEGLRLTPEGFLVSNPLIGRLLYG